METNNIVINVGKITKEVIENLRGGEAKYLLALMLGHAEIRGYRRDRATYYQKRLLEHGLIEYLDPARVPADLLAHAARFLGK
jgi:hypothetical protein